MHTPPRLAARVETAFAAVRPDDPPPGQRICRTADLRRAGLSKRAVRAALAAGLLTRVRTGIYVASGISDSDLAAAREGARVTCVSLLAALGVFVLDAKAVHLHFPRSASKHRSQSRTAVWHWSPLVRSPHPAALRVELIDALVQATVCQPPRAAIATLDSALFHRIIDDDDLDEIFARVPARRRVLRRFVDGRAESGPETFLRLIALMLGFDVEVQVRIRGVGRVDLVLDGWLVVECDSEQFHTGWASQKRDRRRDLVLAGRGMTSLRPVAEDIMYHPESVVAALTGLREARRGAVTVPAAGSVGLQSRSNRRNTRTSHTQPALGHVLLSDRQGAR